MYGFKINDNGDAVIENGEIQTVSDSELIRQTVRQVLLTNLGEWWLNEDEGIDFDCMLCKKPDYDRVEDNIKSGLAQVDDTFEITSFKCSKIGRKLVVEFTAVNSDGESIEIIL